MFCVDIRKLNIGSSGGKYRNTDKKLLTPTFSNIYLRNNTVDTI